MSARRAAGVARESDRFRLLERVDSWCLVQMAKIAARRDDIHEAQHILAAMNAGESRDCGPICPYRKPTAITSRPLGWPGSPQ